MSIYFTLGTLTPPTSNNITSQPVNKYFERNELTTVSRSQSSDSDLNSSSDEGDFDPMILVSMLYL